MYDHDDQRELVERVIERTRHLADVHKASNAEAARIRRASQRERHRAGLNETREQLHRRGVALRQELEAVRQTNDPNKLRSLSRQLRQHHEDLSRYWAALEQFHSTFAPLSCDT